MTAALILAGAVAAVRGVVRSQTPEGVIPAGNYDRDSEEYKDFLDFVRDNAGTARHIQGGMSLTQQEETLLERDGVQEAVIYSLDKETVEELGQPGNAFFGMGRTVEDGLEALEKQGLAPALCDSRESFRVTVEPYGVLKSDFSVEDIWEIPGRAAVTFHYDFVSRELYGIYVEPLEEKDRLLAAETAEALLSGLLPQLSGSERIDAGVIAGNMEAYREKITPGAVVYSVLELEELNVRFYEAPGEEEAVGIHIFREEGNAPPYCW